MLAGILETGGMHDIRDSRISMRLLSESIALDRATPERDPTTYRYRPARATSAIVKHEINCRNNRDAAPDDVEAGASAESHAAGLDPG